MLAYAHVGDGHRMPLEHFLAWSIQGPKVPEALTAREGQLITKQYQLFQIIPAIFFYVKTIYSEQFLTKLH